MEGEFGVVDTVEEVVAKGIKLSAAKAYGRSRGKDGNAEFTTKKKGVVSIGEAIVGVVSRETV